MPRETQTNMTQQNREKVTPTKQPMPMHLFSCEGDTAPSPKAPPPAPLRLAKKAAKLKWCVPRALHRPIPLSNCKAFMVHETLNQSNLQKLQAHSKPTLHNHLATLANP